MVTHIRIRNFKITAALLPIACIAVGFSGCGAQSFSKSEQVSYPTYQLGNAGTTSAVTPLPSPLPSASPVPVTRTGIPPYQTRVGTVGYNSQTFTVLARNILKVRFTPGIQDQTVSGTGYMPQYSQLGVRITINGSSQMTSVLPNGYAGTAAQDSAILDFSGALGSLTGCSASDPACRYYVTVTVDHPSYDYWCLNYQSYCPFTTVWSTHPWHGNLSIETDDTDPIQ